MTEDVDGHLARAGVLGEEVVHELHLPLVERSQVRGRRRKIAEIEILASRNGFISARLKKFGVMGLNPCCDIKPLSLILFSNLPMCDTMDFWAILLVV